MVEAPLREQWQQRFDAARDIRPENWLTALNEFNNLIGEITQTNPILLQSMQGPVKPEVKDANRKDVSLLTDILLETGISLRVASPPDRNYPRAHSCFGKVFEFSTAVGDQERNLFALQGFIDLARTADRDSNYQLSKDKGQALAQASQIQEQVEPQLGNIVDTPSPAKVKMVNEFGLLALDKARHEGKAEYPDQQKIEELWQNSQKYHETAEAAARKLTEQFPHDKTTKELVLRAMENKTALFVEVGKLHEAEEVAKKVLEEYRGLKDRRGISNALLSLARINTRMSKPDEAKSFYNQMKESNKDDNGKIIDQEHYDTAEEAIKKLETKTT